MSDPIGTLGAAPRKDDELGDIYRGGDKFLERMRALSSLRDAQEAAFLNLQIGNDAVSAKSAAAAALADATAKQNEAVKVLNDAKAKAAALIAEANNEATATKAQAAALLKTADESAASVRAAADRYAAETKTIADVVMAKATAALKEAQNKNNEVNAALQRHQTANQEAINSKNETDRLQKILQAKIDLLHKGIKEAVEA